MAINIALNLVYISFPPTRLVLFQVLDILISILVPNNYIVGFFILSRQLILNVKFQLDTIK